jgi:transposase
MYVEAMEPGLAGIEVLGVERRRRWPDAAKLSILAEVGVDGWTVTDVARRHDVTRQHLYQWRRELRLKGLWAAGTSERFVAVEVLPAPVDCRPTVAGTPPEMTIILSNGRQLRCRETIGEQALGPLLRLLEAP